MRATASGRQAQEIWGPLFGVVDDRWRERFGDHAIADLRSALSAIAGRLELDLPDCLPILGYGLFSAGRHSGDATYRPRNSQSSMPDRDGNLPLSALLSRALLAIGANVLRVLDDDDGVRVRDLPRLTGVSKEAVAMSAGYLDKVGCVTIEPVPAPDRGQRLRLAARGRRAQQYADTLVSTVEADWQTRFGIDAVRALRSSLEPLVADGATPSPLLGGLTPYPEGWRAAVRTPSTLPHYPMVLHRGGYPDGS